MSGLCGWFALEPRAAAAASRMDAAGAALRRFDGARLTCASQPWGGVGVAAPEGAVYSGEELIAAVFGRPRFAEPALAAAAARQGAARALADGYRRLRKELPAALQGSFAVAVLDRAAGQALLAVDRVATRSICYASVDGALLFASTLDALNVLAPDAARLNRQAIYDYVRFHVVPGPRTVYMGRHRLEPGCALNWENGRASIARYWRVRFVEDRKRAFAELKQDFLARLRASVAEEAAGASVGSFLSGGTDSSTVAGMLREVTGDAPRTYSIGFAVPGFDEARFARIAAKHFGTRHREYYVTPADVVGAVPRLAAVHDQPFGNASAVPTYYCARLAREDGVARLLGGDGGDELFGGNARYALQRVYAAYDCIPGVVRRRLIEPTIDRLPGIGIFGKLRRYVATASLPMPDRYDHYNLLERVGPEKVFTADFLACVDREAPKAQCAAVYGEVQARSLINRMLGFDLKYTLADNDLPKVSRSCELAGVEARFPLLDDRVVAFAALLEPRLKLKGTRLRYFFKRALGDFLPGEIISKKKHGFGLPFGSWLAVHGPLQELTFDSLGDLKRRGIVRPAFIDELRTERLQEHPEYFGTMAWLLLMLEQWFRQRQVTA